MNCDIQLNVRIIAVPMHAFTCQRASSRYCVEDKHRANEKLPRPVATLFYMGARKSFEDSRVFKEWG